MDKKVQRALQNKLKEDVISGMYDEIIPTSEMKANIIANSKRVINHILECEELDDNIQTAIEDAILLYLFNKKS